jgi:hypothetical protein
MNNLNKPTKFSILVKSFKMEEEITPVAESQDLPKPTADQKPQVYILRDWKEYAGESFLIIFSVLLALVLTEYINNLHEKNETKELLRNVRNELMANKKAETEQYAYHLQVLKSIDSALVNVDLQKKIVSNDEFHLKYIAPQGVMYRYLDDIAWEVAKNHNISAKVSFPTVKMLTYIYQDQARIMKAEDEIAKVFLSRDAGKVENAHATLILIKNNYKGWAVDRAPGLLKQYDKAIKVLGEEE